jgi:hypothetical protein
MFLKSPPGLTAGVIALLAIGVTAHDVASIYGIHIHGFHALYFAIPIAVISGIIWYHEVSKAGGFSLIKRIKRGELNNGKTT